MCSSSRRRTCSPATRPMTRRTRTKTRRPKYLSLRLQLTHRSQTETAPDVIMPSDDHHHHLACLLDPGYGGATLTDLLGGGPPPEAAHEPLSSPSPASSSMNWDDAYEEKLARMALRGRERWVSSEEVASRIDPLWCGAPRHGLSLKLDYEEILTAWSDRRSLYIDGEGAQVVPELRDNTTMFVEVGSVGSSWRVPEEAPPLPPAAAAEGSSREARVRRYKEKRRSRLFAKRIRYEVRKLNAEKRPRMKGRFVKRKEDE